MLQLKLGGKVDGASGAAAKTVRRRSNGNGRFPPEGTRGFWIIGEDGFHSGASTGAGVYSRSEFQNLVDDEVIGEDDVVLFFWSGGASVIQRGGALAVNEIPATQQKFLRDFSEKNEISEEMKRSWRTDKSNDSPSIGFDGVIDVRVPVEEEE